LCGRIRRDTFRLVILQNGVRIALILTIASLAAVLLALAVPARTQGQTDEAPALTFSSPEDGATVSNPPSVITLCFAEPISTQDLNEGDDFFVVTAPGDFRLGLRIVFQGDGLGVTIQPNVADADPAEGAWTVDYHVSSADRLASTEGQIAFTVASGDAEPGRPTSSRCLESGFTATPDPNATSGPTTSSTAPPETSATPAPGDDEDDDDSDTLLIVLLVLGASAVVGLIVLVGYLIQRRRKQESQAPSPNDDPGS